MALTEFQRRVCRLLAGHRVASGESYVAGGAALSEITSSPRISRDVDLFHDTEEAVSSTWEADRKLLESGGMSVRPVRERPSFVAALPREEAGKCVLGNDGSLLEEGPGELPGLLAGNRVLFRAGRICGALPRIKGDPAA
jgi:hypothetical protein